MLGTVRDVQITALASLEEHVLVVLARLPLVACRDAPVVSVLVPVRMSQPEVTVVGQMVADPVDWILSRTPQQIGVTTIDDPGIEIE